MLDLGSGNGGDLGSGLVEYLTVPPRAARTPRLIDIKSLVV